MTINLLSCSLDGFSLNSNLLQRTLNGFYGISKIGFDYPLTVQISQNRHNVIFSQRVFTVVLDQ